MMQIGSKGSAPGQFIFPAAIHVSYAGDVWVADPRSRRVQRFTADTGGLSGIITGSPQYPEPVGDRAVAAEDPHVAAEESQESDQEATNFADRNARARAPGGDGNGNCAQTRMKEAGSATAGGSFGGKVSEDVMMREKLKYPNGVAVGVDGKVYVCDSGHDRVRVFGMTDGGYAEERARCGTFGRGPRQFDHPVALAIRCSTHMFGDVYVHVGGPV
jgi:DNA-binding beta-propeller fold protein YncE